MRRPGSARVVIRVALLGLALALTAGAAGAVDKWIAFGDSIMVGSTFPTTGPEPGCTLCPSIFDCSGGCSHSPGAARELCSVPRRLEAWINGVKGGSNDVLNYGWAGETTADGVARLPSVLSGECGTPGDCIAVILMEGTNDMLPPRSVESTTFNLYQMIQEARSRNIDTLLMSIIRKIWDPGNAKWAAFHDLVVGLAASEDLPLADVYEPLCPDEACFNANYWVPSSCGGVPGENTVGHPDPQGYDIMNNVVTAAFPGAVPAAPSTTSPAGDICIQTPQYVWPEVPAARWYALELDATTTTWWRASASCAGGTCTATPPGSLAAGPHSWRVRGRNLLGRGAFSATANFTVGPPPAPTAVAPSGSFFPFAPTYEWLEIPCATEYDYEVRDAMGNLEAQATGLLASAVCSGGLCRHQGGTISDADTYTLKVLARNALGAGPLSPTGSQFTILACADPSAKDLNELEPSPVTATKTVSHCGPVTAGPYVVEATGNLTVHTGGGFTAQEGFTVAGTLTIQSP